MTEVSTLAGFELLGELGRGGMGVVYLARDEALGRFVAIKVLSPDRVRGAAGEERLRREARALSQLSHPGIVAVHAFGQTPAGPYIVMEYVSGTPLSVVLARGRPPRAEWLDVVAQAAAALTYAHRAGVVHRDIKPSNALVTTESTVGASPRIKLVDFGLATLVGALDQGPLTRPGGFVGTACYVAPEQALGRVVDGRADVYGLTVLALEGLSGCRLMRSGLDAGESLDTLLTTPCELEPEVARVLARGLATRPEDRFPTPSAFAEALLDAAGARGGPVADAGARAVAVRRAHGYHVVMHVELGAGPHDSEPVTSAAADLAHPEALSTALASSHAAVLRHHGVLAGVSDGAIVAIFGPSTGAISPAESGALAALETAASFAAVARDVATAPSAKRPATIGIAGGHVRVEASASRLLLASGEAFAEARRLAASAQTTPICTPAVFVRARGAVAGTRIGSAADPAYALEATGIRRGFGAPELYGQPVPFFGRDRVLKAILHEVDATSRERRARVVVISGAHGVGRTRLLQEVAAALALRDESYVLEIIRFTSEARLLEALADAVMVRAGLLAGEPETVLRLKLDYALRHLQPAGCHSSADTEALIDGLVRLVSGAHVDVGRTLGALWERLAARHPVVVLLDDLDRAGADGVALLQRVLSALDALPFIVVATTGPDFRPATPCVPLAIGPLSPLETEALFRELLHGAPLPHAHLVALAHRSGGLPLEVEQRLHDLVDRGALIPTGGAWTLDLDRWDDREASPLRTQLEGLTANAVTTLEAAALAVVTDSVSALTAHGAAPTFTSEPIWAAQLAAMLDGDEAVEELVTRGLLAVRGDHRIDGEPDLTFAVPSLAASLTGRLPHPRRAELHERAARWLALHAGSKATLAVTLARHWEGAGHLDRALDAARRAAERGARAGTPSTAATAYERAVDLARRLGQNPRPLLAAFTEQLVLAGRLERALTVSEPEPANLVLPIDPTEARIRFFRGRALERLGRFADAAEAYSDSERLGLGDDIGLRAAIAAAAIAAKLGHPDHAARRLAELTTVESGSLTTASEAHRQHGNALLRLGQLDAAERALEIAQTLAEDAGALDAELDAANGLAAAAYFAGRLVDAERRFRAALRLAERGQFLQHQAVISNNLGEIYLALEQFEEAEATLARALRLYRSLGSDEGIADSARLAAHAALRLERPITTARDLATESLSAARRTGSPTAIAAAEAQLARCA